MRKSVGLLLLCGGLASADSIGLYYDQASFNTAAAQTAQPGGSMSYQSESFANNVIQTPWFSITSCYYGPGASSDPNGGCGTIAAGQGKIGNGQVVNGAWTDADGGNPHNVITGAAGQDTNTTFNLPKGVTAVSFTIDVAGTAGIFDPSNSAWDITVLNANGTDSVIYPFGGGNILDGTPSNAYAGFLGLVNGGGITGLEFNEGDVTWQASDITIGSDPVVPEPASCAIVGLGLVGLAGFRRLRICQ